MYYVKKNMIYLNLWMMISVMHVKAYRFDDLNRFQQIGNRVCWDAMLLDVNAKLTTLGSCFYPKNSSLSPHLVPSLFINGSSRLPDVLFNPLHYADFVGFTDEMYYSHETFHLTTNDGVKAVKTRGLNHTLAMQVMEGDKKAVKNQYTQFCAVQTHFRPVLDCLSNEIPTLLDYYKYYCLEEESMDVLLGIQLSIINWELYENFCEEIFRCSPNPLGECRAKQNPRVDRSAPVATMESICTIMPDFNAKIVPCVLDRIRDCPNRIKVAYNTFIYDIQVFQQQFLPNTDAVRSLCRLVENTCPEHDHWEMMNSVTDECFESVYDISRNSDGIYLDRIIKGEGNAVPQIEGMPICYSFMNVKTCVQDSVQMLPCRQNYRMLVEELLMKITAACRTYLNRESTSFFSTLFPTEYSISGVTFRPPWWRQSTSPPIQLTFGPTTRPIPQPISTPPIVATPRVITVNRPTTATPRTTRRIAQQQDSSSTTLESSFAPFLCMVLLSLLCKWLV